MSRRAWIAVIALVLCGGADAAFAEERPTVTPPTEERPAAAAPGERPVDTAPTVDRPTFGLRLDYSSSDKNLTDRRDLFGATLEARWQPTLGDNLKAVLDGRVGSLDFARGNGGYLRLNEAYVAKRFEGADLRIGQQIVAWGRADGINPTDNLTPRDFKTLLPMEADQRFGVPSVKLDVFPAPDYKLSFYATPFFEPSVFPLPIPEGVSSNERKPSREIANTTFAMKLDRTAGELDWSISWFHGFSLLPIARPVELFPVPTVELNYPKVDVLGADFARNLGQFGLRGEVAYIHPHKDMSIGSERLQPTLFYVFGGDRAFGNLNINVQFVGRYVFGYRDVSDIPVPALQQLALQNAVTFGQRDRATYGITARIADRWLSDRLEAEVLLYAGVNRQDLYVRPLVSYAFKDQLKGRVGAEIYEGGQDTFFGRLDQNRRVFVELIYNF